MAWAIRSFGLGYVGALLLCLAFFSARMAYAEDRPTWQIHLDRALTNYRAGLYEEALLGFEVAHREKPLPRILINIGQVNRKLGRTKEALAAFEQYLMEEPGFPEPELRLLVKQQMQKLTSISIQKNNAQESIQRHRWLAESRGPTVALHGFSPGGSGLAMRLGMSLSLAGTIPAPARRFNLETHPLYRRADFWLLLATGAAGIAVGIVGASGAFAGPKPDPHSVGSPTSDKMELFIH